MDFSQLATVVAFASFAVASLAVVFAVRGDRRKSGVDIRCNVAISSSIWSKEKWVSEIRLANAKDRAVTVHKIYLEIGYGLYIEVEDFTQEPLTLDPYAGFQKEYDPIDFYSHGNQRVTGFFNDKKVRTRILLITSLGRHYPRSDAKSSDDPWLDQIGTNITTTVLSPRRLTYKGRSYGSEAKFIVTLSRGGQEDQVAPIYPDDYRIHKFRNFGLTEWSLESKQALESFLWTQVREGKLSADDIHVLDLEAARDERYEAYTREALVSPQGWFTHKVLGRVVTVSERRALERENRKRVKTRV